MRVERTVTLTASPEQVWSVIAEPARYDELLGGAGSWTPSGTGTGVGARFRLRMQVGSVLAGGLVEIVEYQPQCELAWTSVTGIDHRGRWRVREVGDGRTRVSLRLSYQTPGRLFGMLVDTVSAPIVGRNLTSALKALRAQVDRG